MTILFNHLGRLGKSDPKGAICAKVQDPIVRIGLRASSEERAGAGAGEKKALISEVVKNYNLRCWKQKTRAAASSG